MRVVDAVVLVRDAGCKSVLSIGPDGQFVVISPFVEHRLTFSLVDFLRMKEKVFVARLQDYIIEKKC